MMLRVGVLLPRSSLFPALGLDILNGIKSCLKHNDVQGAVTFLTDNIGFGIEEAEIYTKAERLISSASSFSITSSWPVRST